MGCADMFSCILTVLLPRFEWPSFPVEKFGRLFLHVQIILNGIDSFDASGDFTGFNDGILAVNETECSRRQPAFSKAKSQLISLSITALT
jgi:hypothetical protein